LILDNEGHNGGDKACLVSTNCYLVEKVMKDIDKVNALLTQGENSGVEFKTSQAHPDSVAREMTAFANSQGGTLLIGVNDNGTIEGVYNIKIWEQWIANIARHNIIPPINVKYKQIDIQGKPIGVIDIPKGCDKPYQTSKNQFLVRIGSTSRVATQGELMRLFQQAGVFHYDLTGVTRTSVKDLNITKIAEYFQRYDVDITQEDDQHNLLCNTDILTEDGLVTVGGLMVFGIQPQRYLHNSSITYAHFAGSRTDADLIDRQLIEGTIDMQIDSCMAVIRNNFFESSTIRGAKRIIQNVRYPEKVFRELLVNACVHRNYAISGSRIRIFHFDDKIEFISPGRLPNTVTIEKLKRGVSYAVNPVLLKFMENLRYIDKLGRGIPMVIHEAAKLGFQPEFAEIGDEFQVVLPLKH